METTIAFEELKILLKNQQELEMDGRNLNYGDQSRIQVLRNFLDNQNKPMIEAADTIKTEPMPF